MSKIKYRGRTVMKPVMKRLISLVICFVMTFTVTACGKGTDQKTSNPGKDGDKVVINFFHRWPNEPKNTFFNEAVKEFESLHPNVKINVDKVLNDSYKEKIRVLASNEDLPDIFSSWSDSFAENIVSSGKVKPLDHLFEEDKEWGDNILKSQLGAFTFNGKIYGVPLTIDGKVFAYNTKIFKENGIEPPKTFEEFIKILDKLKKAGYENPIMEGLSDSWAIAHYIGTINQRLMDPAVLEKDYNPKTGEFTDLGYIDALKAFKRLTDYMGETATAIDHETARNMFVNGKVPIVYMQLSEIKYVEDQGMKDFAFFDFPPFENGKGDPNSLTGAPEGFMLSKNAPKEAEEFLKFLTSKEMAFKFTKECGQLNAIKGAVTSENASPKSLESYDLILKSSKTAPWFDNAVNASIVDIFMRGGQSMAIGEMTPEEVMNRVQKEATKLRSTSK